MKTQSRTYYSTLLEGFLMIDSGDFREKVRYAEKNMNLLQKLESMEFFEIMIRYNEALFELGSFQKQIRTADVILEMSITHNIVRYDGKDIFFETLFKKAAALFNSGRLPEAIHILKELLKLNPKHESSKLFLINCFVKERKQESYPYRAVSVGAILLSAFVIAGELLIVRPYYESYIDHIELIRNFLFGLGVISLVTGEVLLRYRAVDQCLELIKYYKERKETKEKELTSIF